VLMTLRSGAIDTPCIVVTGGGGEDAAVDALVAGADDYVSKSRLARLLPALQRSIAAAAARRQERAEFERRRLLPAQASPASGGHAAEGEAPDAFATAISELAAGLAWFADHADHAKDDAAMARVQTMQRVLERARGK
jgi:DNA-binding NtrC family response regulator